MSRPARGDPHPHHRKRLQTNHGKEKRKENSTRRTAQQKKTKRTNEKKKNTATRAPSQRHVLGGASDVSPSLKGTSRQSTAQQHDGESKANLTGMCRSHAIGDRDRGGAKEKKKTNRQQHDATQTKRRLLPNHTPTLLRQHTPASIWCWWGAVAGATRASGGFRRLTLPPDVPHHPTPAY
jgi:TFIIF-interacting CTD phosphatase-like protein